MALNLPTCQEDKRTAAENAIYKMLGAVILKAKLQNPKEKKRISCRV
jgi:hypothetical protein